jgi:hypothetical protein
MINDPIVEEVRKVREELFEKCGNDLNRYMEFIRLAETKHAGRRITSPEMLRSVQSAAHAKK